MIERRCTLGRYTVLMLLYAFLPVSMAGSETQTDWSDGQGASGPVWHWDSAFSSCSDVDWSGSQGAVSLARQVSGRFIATTELRTITAIGQGDIDGDGYPDVIGSWLDNLACWLNAGSDAGWQMLILDCGTISSLATADLNGDGFLDIVGALPDADRISWWMHPGGPGGIWIRRKVCSYARASILCVEDIDGDGDTDIAGGGYNGLAWWENRDGTGTSWEYHRVADMVYHTLSIAVGDLDGDSDTDVVSSDGRGLYWWENGSPGSGGWEMHDVDDTARSVISISLADIDSDGDIDVTAAWGGGGEIDWWENEGSEVPVWERHEVGGVDSVRASVAADLDADGDIDMVAGGVCDGAFCWFENTSQPDPVWLRHDVGDEEYALKLLAADIDLDGAIEVVGAINTGPPWPYRFEVRWYDFIFEGDGSLTSTVLCADCLPRWGSLEWSADEPEGTCVSFRVRASEDYTSMGPWSAELTSPCSLCGILGEGCRFFQYLVFLETSDSSLSPYLESVSVSWDSSTVEEEPSVSGVYPLTLYPVTPNPSEGEVLVRFSLPATAPVDVTVYDLAGRVVETAFSGEAPPGCSQCQVSGLVPGLYLCSMRSCGYSACRRFAVIE